MDKLEKVLDMLKYKYWHYDEAIKDGNEGRVLAMLPDQLPETIQMYYDNSHYN